MSAEERAAFINAQSTCALLHGMGMWTENARCARHNLPPTYSEGDFKALVQKHGLGFDALTEFFRGH